MSIRIDGGTVVGWSGAHHELIEGGSVLIEGARIVSVGRGRAAGAGRVIDATGKLVCPGFINLHWHPTLNDGDYLVTDATRSDYRYANYHVFAAVFEGRRPEVPKAAVAAARAYAMLSALRNGATSVVDAGGPADDPDDLVEIAARVGGRVFTGPAFVSRDIVVDREGRIGYGAHDAARGRRGLDQAVEFVRRHDGAHGRVHGILNPVATEMVDAPLFRDAALAARDLGVPLNLHAGSNLREFDDLLQTFGRTPIEWLADCGVLGPRTIIGHAAFIAGHPLAAHGGDDLGLLAGSGTTVAHCPRKLARFGAALHSFDRYLARGINMGIGTDTFPLDIVAEMRFAAYLSRVIEGTHLAGRPRDVFDAVTVNAARALGRDDLGRIAAGARADILIVDLRKPAYGMVRDPVAALVDFASGCDVETVIVEGEVVIEAGRSTRVDEDSLYREADRVTQAAWNDWPRCDWAGRRVEDIVPPAYPRAR